MKPISKYADLMTLEEWVESVKDGMLMEDDGFGYYATATHQSIEEIPFYEDINDYDKNFTHVVWFNK
jgi:hypothetical protein